jgi:hypothetical protein
MSLNALLVVHGWCLGIIASLGNAPVRSLLEREVAEIRRPARASAGAHAWHDPAMANRGGTRLLIATGETATSEDELPRLVRALIDSASEVLVMTPVLVSRLQWLASDTDRARYEADERLSSLLGQVDTLAPEATVRGRIGDDTPLTAFSDAIREFSPDHILIALRSDHSGWQERGLLDEIRGFGIPITVFELDRTGRSPIRT